MPDAKPLVVAVDCLGEPAQQACVRSALGSSAELAGVGFGWPRSADVGVLERAAVVLMRSLHELSGGVAPHLSSRTVVLTAPWCWEAELELAAELHVARVLRAMPGGEALAEERADTEVALITGLVRKTFALQLCLQRGAWLPPHSAYRGARRCSSLLVGLVGLDESTAGVAKRCTAFGMRVVFVHPLPARDTICEPTEEDLALVSAAIKCGATAAASLTALLGNCDVIALHSPPEAGTVLGAAQIGGLHCGQYLVHTGSTGLDCGALKKALFAKQLAGAALDAPDTDAFLEAASRETRGLVLTQRGAAHSDEADRDAALPAARLALAVIRGEV